METEQPVPSAPARSYDLVQRKKGAWVVVRHRDSGITLDADGLEWTSGGRLERRRYADIRSIGLSTGHIPRSGTFGTCEITFADFTLLVMSVDSWGYADDARNALYGDFVRDLHKRLGERERGRIAFNGGISANRMMFARTAIGLAAAFFVGLPIVLLVVTRDMQALFIALGGGLFVYPLFAFLRRNAPQTYRPDAIGPELLP